MVLVSYLIRLLDWHAPLVENALLKKAPSEAYELVLWTRERHNTIVAEIITNLDGGSFSNRALVETYFEASKTLFFK